MYTVFADTNRTGELVLSVYKDTTPLNKEQMEALAGVLQDRLNEGVVVIPQIAYMHKDEVKLNAIARRVEMGVVR